MENNETLTNENYFSQENEHDYMSYSQFKDFLHCEAMGLAKAEGRFETQKKSKALLQGSYIDAYFSGEMEQFKNENPDIFKKDGTLKSDYEICNRVIEAIENDPTFLEEFYKGETQVVLTGEIAGVMFKGKIDMLYEDKIVDMKAMANLDPVWDEEEHRKKPFYSFYKYDIQACIYQELARQRVGKKLPYYLAVTTKEENPRKAVYLFSQEVLDEALELVKALAPRYDAIKKHLIEPNECGHCEYYAQTHKFEIYDIQTITKEDM